MLKPNKKVLEQDVKNAVLANAVGTGAYVISVGDCIQPGATGHNSYVTGAASSGLVLGVITAIRQSGKICEKTSITGVAAALTGTPSTGPGTDNETYKVWSVDYIPAYIDMEYVADIDAAAGTTTNSGGNGFLSLLGVSTTAGHAGTLDESSIALFGGSAGQFATYGVVPGTTTKVVGRINQAL